MVNKYIRINCFSDEMSRRTVSILAIMQLQYIKFVKLIAIFVDFVIVYQSATKIALLFDLQLLITEAG